MKNRKIVIISLIIALIFFGVNWISEINSEKKFQDYMLSLEQSNCYVEEYPFSDSHVAGVLKIYFFSDFQNYAIQEKIDHIYCDRETNVLYFFHPIGNNKVEIIFFNY